MATISRNASAPKAQKDLVEIVEHFKAKADHIPSGIVNTLSLATSKAPGQKSQVKTISYPTAAGKNATHAIVAKPDNAWNYPRQRSTFNHLTKNTPCYCGAGRDISFLYDATVVGDRSKPLSSFARSRMETAGSKEVTRVGDHGMKTPQLEEEQDWAGESLIPEEYHVVQCGGVHGLKIQDATHTTLTEEHTTHVTLFPSLKPTSRKEVIQLGETMEQLLKEAGCGEMVAEPTEVHNLLNLIKKEQHIYNTCFHELIRQVTVQCKDRGKLLANIRENYQKLLDRIPRQIMSLHQEVMAQRALDRRLTDELIRFKTAISALSKELNEVREHDQEVTQQALEAQKDLASALSESEKNANLVAEYHSLYEIQRSRLEFQISTLNKERDLWSKAVYDLAVKVCHDRNLKTARRLQLCEQAWNKLGGHFGLVLADVDSKALQDLQTAVENWRRLVDGFASELDSIDSSMQNQLERILQEVILWRDDLTVRVRPTGRVEIPPDYPVQDLFENCRMWEEMLSVLIERFSGDTLLASQEDLTKISRLVDTWKDTAIKIFSHHPRKDSKRHPCHESLLVLDKECEDLMTQFQVRVSGENGVARGIISLVNPIETWGNRLMQVSKGEDSLSDAEWAKLLSNLQEWAHTVHKTLSRLSTSVVISEEDDITTIPPSIMEDMISESDLSDSDQSSIHSSEMEDDSLTLEKVLGNVDRWLRTTTNTIDNEDAVINETVSILHNDMIRWMVMMILELTHTDAIASSTNLTEDSKSVDHIGGMHAKLSNFSTAGKAVCNKLREFTSKITKCCNDVVLEIVTKRKESRSDNPEAEYKDLKRLETECEEWIKTAHMLIREAGGEIDFPDESPSQQSITSASKLPAPAPSVQSLPEPEPLILPEPKKAATDSQLTISTEETPHPTEVKGEKNVFVLGEDQNIQPSTMDEILSRSSSASDKSGDPTAHLPSRVPGKTGNPLSDAETHVNLVNELHKQVQDTVNRATGAETKLSTAETALAAAKCRIADLEKELEEEKSKQPPVPQQQAKPSARGKAGRGRRQK